MSDVMLRLDPDLTIDPDLAKLMQPIYAKWETAILRVAAAHANPGTVLIPNKRGTPEALLQARFSALDAARQQRAGQRATEQLAFKKRLTRNGRFIDMSPFTDTNSVDDRVLAPPKQPTPRQMQSIAARHLSELGLPGQDAVGPLFGSKTLRLELVRVVCIDETNGFLGTEVGKDEIYITGVALDGTTNIGQIGPTKVGNFDDGTTIDTQLPAAAKNLFAFDLTGTTTYPRLFFATLILVEKDAGNLNQTIKDIINKIAKEAIDKIVALIGAAIGSGGGPLGALIGLAVGWLVGKIVAKLIAIWEDDLFTPRTLEVVIPDANATSLPSQVFHARGPGEYALRYQWKLLKSRPTVATAGVVSATRGGG